jgi:hypothetical protein
MEALHHLLRTSNHARRKQKLSSPTHHYNSALRDYRQPGPMLGRAGVWRYRCLLELSDLEEVMKQS